MRIFGLTEFILLVYSVAVTVYCVSLKRRIKSADDPVLALPRRERRAYARKQLAHREDEYIQQQIRKNMNIIQEGENEK